MNLSAIGEFGLIRRIAPRFLEHLGNGVTGIGDDCAVIPWKRSASLLVTTDMLVENIHFLRARIRPEDLGYKSLAVNLSDIAAMGGTPESAYISIALPPDIPVEWVDEFYSGLGTLAASEQTDLLGGDTTRSPAHIVINITVLGRVHPKFVKLRSAARPGDILCVTDTLGDSGGGLRSLIENRPGSDATADLVRRHTRPRPHLAEGMWLSTHDGVHAMMDVSDGIDSDIRRIMERSNCGADIDTGSLPISKALTEACGKFGWNAAELASTGGEDYCLLATIAPGSYASLADEFEVRFGRPLYRIGTVSDNPSALRYFERGEVVSSQAHGYDHFQ